MTTAVNRNNVTTTSPDGQTVGRNGGGYGLFNLNRRKGGSNWEPSTFYLVALVILEFVAYCALRYAFRSVHGG